MLVYTTVLALNLLLRQVIHDLTYKKILVPLPFELQPLQTKQKTATRLLSLVMLTLNCLERSGLLLSFGEVSRRRNLTGHKQN